MARLGALVNWEDRRRAPSPGSQGSGMRVDIGPARDLFERLGSPQRGLRVVHVAGTKGKGSLAALVERAMLAAGLAVGRYASPHVERLNERVALRGADIDDGALAEVLGAALDARDAAVHEGSAGAAASWFDVLTAAAIEAFRAAELDWAVVECGLGGRLDSTNALSGEVCVVTNVDLEHTEILGSTLAQIAREKVAIVDAGATLVTGVPAASEAGAVVDEHARALGVRVVRPGGRPASIDAENEALAGLVLEELGRRGVAGSDGRPLGAHLLDDATRLAARLPGRMERFDVGGVPVVLDGAHVASSLRRVLADLDRREGLSGRPCVAVVGLGADKDAEALLKVLSDRVDRGVCTSVGTGPVATADELSEAARRIGWTAETAAAPRVALQQALELAGRYADGSGWVLVTGSLHLIGALRPHLLQSRC